VRRLGADFHLVPKWRKSRKGIRRLIPVQVTRARNAFTRIKYATKKLGAIKLGKIYFAGIRPAVTYASEIQGITPQTLKVLERGAHAAVPYTALAVPRSMSLYATPTTNLPLYDQISAPILRWARWSGQGSS
jgi:hypothetical protein